MNLVPSVVFKGYRFRAIWSTLYYRALSETFHEFLIFVVKLTFGKRWWMSQVRDARNRHAVVAWWFEWCEVTKTREHRLGPDGVTRSGNATGPTWALLQLGYDLFCLQAKNKLPDFMVERLRKHKDFQSVRYELAVAAIMARAGFEIEYLDDKAIDEKHCELIATHPGSGLRIGVEAKSRRRAGVLHERGEFSRSPDARGLEKLLRKARKQKPAGIPLLIFVDTNLPPEHDIPNEEKSLVKDLKGVMERIGGNRPDAPDPHAALFVTNFAYHYGWPDGNSYKGEWILVLPRYTQHPVPMPLLQRIYATTGRYDTIPDEI